MTDPSDIPARWATVRAAIEQQRFADALRLLCEFPGAVRDEFQVMAHEADLLGRLGDHEAEIGLLGRLIERHPAMASLWVSLANAQKTLGRTNDAIASLRHAIAIDPNYGKPWWLLSDLKRFRFDDADIAAMEQLLGRGGPDSDRASVHFALAKAYEDRGQTERSFGHYAQGNRLRAAATSPEGATMTPKVDRSIALYTTEFLAARAGFGSPSPAPIFIVGLQRSGSTLIEQILASHPLIEGTSELPLIPQLNREVALDPALVGDLFDRLAQFDRDQWRAIGEEYLARAAAFRHSDRPYFIDKLPGNWTNIGFIRLALPGATIIDARRHPLATGFSNFKQNYNAGAAFSFDLVTIGQYYRDYLRMMTHFERVDPGAIHRVVNEALIDAFEPQVRALLAHVGVPFDPACLDFHTNARAVRTPSAEQVRRPINRDGVDQWHAVEPWLGPLKQALGPALAGWNAPPGSYCDEDR